MPQIETPQPVQTENPEEQLVVEAPKFRSMEADNDKNTIAMSHKLFNKMHNVEQQEYRGEEIIKPVIINNDQGDMAFESTGGEKSVNIYPYDQNTEYNIAFVDEQGNVLQEFDGLRGVFQSKVNFIKGNYKILIQSRKGGSMPFTAKIS